MAVPAVSSNHTLIFSSFLVFEMCYGKELKHHAFFSLIIVWYFADFYRRISLWNRIHQRTLHPNGGAFLNLMSLPLPMKFYFQTIIFRQTRATMMNLFSSGQIVIVLVVLPNVSLAFAFAFFMQSCCHPPLYRHNYLRFQTHWNTLQLA